MHELVLLKLFKKRNYNDINEFLVKNHDKINSHFIDKNGKSILLKACESRNAEIVELVFRYIKFIDTDILEEAFIYCCKENLNYSAYQIIYRYNLKNHVNDKEKIINLIDIALNSRANEIVNFLYNILKELQDNLNKINYNPVFHDIYKLKQKPVFEGLLTLIPYDINFSKVNVNKDNKNKKDND